MIYQQIISMLPAVNLSAGTHVLHRDATFTLLALSIISEFDLIKNGFAFIGQLPVSLSDLDLIIYPLHAFGSQLKLFIQHLTPLLSFLVTCAKS